MFGEGLGYMYAATYGISVVCVRIGNFSGQRRDPEHPHHLGIPDCVQLFSESLAILPAVEMVRGGGVGSQGPDGRAGAAARPRRRRSRRAYPCPCLA